jgi:serine/threonine-protein kinase
MTSERWDLILEIFNAAMEQPKEQRARFLKSACGGDRDLLQEVDSLLDSYDRDPVYLEEPASSLSALAGESIDDGMIGGHLGSYRVVSRIGSGGMGAVYLGERDDEQFRQRVALKVVKRGMDSEEIVRRFRNERKIVAALDHPNIARLFDGGLAADGRPYFVMEYIEGGVPIDAYCDRNALNITERLKLFRTVAAAVHYAHQNLVIHRDLKPGNILISERGEVKLLDFGIAKPLDPERLGMTAAMTRADLRMLTPEYASPEQIRGEAITTASDVYALGVLLYELLTGHRPYRLKSRTASEIERAICEEEPEKPSTIVRRPEEAFGSDGSTRTISPEEVSAARGTRLGRLRRELDGDLDNIVLKGMHKDPQRRYASAEALSDDVGRYLNGEPVTARKDALGYRAGKFIGRHKLGVTAASALFTSVSGFGVMMAIQSSRIARQAKEIARQRDKAEQVVTFLKELFRVSDPEVSKGEMITARELLEQGSRRIEQQLKGEPALQAELMYLMGEVFINLGLYDQAETLFSQSLELRQGAFGEVSPEVAQSLYGMGLALRWKGRFREAEQFFRQALTLFGRTLGQEHLLTAETLSDLGVALRHLGDHATAESLYRQALAIQRKLPGADRAVARTLNNLALLLRLNGQKEEAEKLYRETLEIQRVYLGEEHPELATTLNNLARLLSSMGEYDLAEPLDREALAIRRRVLRDHPDIAQSLNNLGTFHWYKGEPEKAEGYFREAIGIWQRLLDPDHPDIANAMNNLARVRHALGDHDEAESLLRDLLVIQRRRFGEEHPDIARTLHALAELMHDRGDAARAESCYREALAMRRTLLGDENWRTALTALGLGGLLVEEGRYAEAEPFLQESHAVLQSQGHSFSERASHALIDLYSRWGKSAAKEV